MLFYALVLEISHMMTEKLNMHDVPGLCLTSPNNPSSKNMELIILP